jgi:hypothetical protein
VHNVIAFLSSTDLVLGTIYSAELSKDTPLYGIERYPSQPTMTIFSDANCSGSEWQVNAGYFRIDLCFFRRSPGTSTRTFFLAALLSLLNVVAKAWNRNMELRVDSSAALFLTATLSALKLSWYCASYKS